MWFTISINIVRRSINQLYRYIVRLSVKTTRPGSRLNLKAVRVLFLVTTLNSTGQCEHFLNLVWFYRSLYLILGLYFNSGASLTVMKPVQKRWFNTLDARSRSTDFAQTSLRHQKSVDRRHGISTPAPEVGRPTALYINASRQKSVDWLCFLMHTGTFVF